MPVHVIIPRARVSPERTKLGVLKWRCYTTGPYGDVWYEGKGYTVADAYRKWLNALTCRLN